MKTARFIILFFLAPVCAPAALVDGLLNYWNFETNYADSAPTFAGSASTFGDDAIAVTTVGTVTRAASTQFGNAATLAGGGYLRVPNSPDILAAGKSLTISAWFRITAFSVAWQALIAHGEGSDYRIARRNTANKMAYAGGNADIPADAVTGPDVIGGAWHHVVAVTEAGVSTRLWVDGVLVATRTSAVPALVNSVAADLFIGANPITSPNRAWIGDIDDVAMWARPLTDTEISLIYTEGSGPGKVSLGSLLVPGDADNDKLPDFWEVANGFNPNSSVGVDGATGDPDADGSPNLQEYTKGTNPRNPDTDSDFSNDGAEHTRMTNPLVADTDGDGLLDGYETGDGIYTDATHTGTNPLVVDTDGDGVSDGIEVRVYNTNPNNIASVPPATILPFTDDFEDNLFNSFLWRKHIPTLTTGSSVTETGGRIALTGRGYLVSKQEFNPSSVGGMNISGEWTYGTADDFIQILTRSTGVDNPGGATGEPASGVEFFVSNVANSITIRSKTGDHVITDVVKRGRIRMIAGHTYRFSIMDSNTGLLRFSLVDKADALNIAGVTATLFDNIGSGNYITFLNREAARTSYLETVTVARLTDTDNDGLPDEWESANGTNPAVADAGADPDSDGSTNAAEFMRFTKANAADTDGDGANDGSETGTGFFTSLTDRGTLALVPDTDGDTLLDGVETGTGIFVGPTNTGTNPHLADTDGDGVNDGREVAAGRNPNDDSDGRTGLARSLVAYWNFDNNLNDIAQTLPTDSTVADNGSFTGPPTDVGYSLPADAKFGNASLMQNGGDGWVTVPSTYENLAADTNTISISAWFKVNAFSSGWQSLVNHGEGTQYRIARHNALTDMAYAGGAADIFGGPAMDDAAWHHVVAISEAAVGTSLYIDGNLAALGAVPVISNLGNSTTVVPDLFIGANPQSVNREWNGNIDDVAIWRRALTQEEITRIWANGTGTSITALITGTPDSSKIKLVSWSYTNPLFRLEWESAPGQIFRVSYSGDMQNWVNQVTTGLPAATTGTTTSYQFTNPQPAQKKLFFRVERQP